VLSISPSATGNISAQIVKGTAPVVAITLATIFGVTWFVVVIFRALTESAAVVFGSPFHVELTTASVWFVVGANVFASHTVFTPVIVPLVILVISVSGHCFPSLV
jgi:flagellar biosynthesis protein FlhB